MSAIHGKPLTGIEMEFALAKRELAQVKMERDFLKKASAYFAREPQSGTCLRADTHRQARS